MKITKSQLKQIIKEEMDTLLENWEPGMTLHSGDPTSDDPAAFPRTFSEEPPETTDLAEFSPSEAFGMAWMKAIEFLDAAGMGPAARYLEKQSSEDVE
tara:strand:+ start:259 stop:552 length:294 start_codon:yes stop_codon:yes gene_type:complete